MNDLLKKHWTTLIGSLFMLASLITLFKYTSDQGLLTDPIKIGIGLLAGAAVAAAGLTLHRKRSLGGKLVGEIGTGLGVSIWYTTCSYAGIYAAIWDSMTVMLIIMAITAGISLFAYRFSSRLLMGLGLGGAMLAPLVMRPETDQVFTLFLYLLVVNLAFFGISVLKSWLELRIMAFVLTWMMYVVYYLQYTHVDMGWWTMPMRYAIAAFIFYLIAFYAAAWKEKCGYAGINIYSSFANTVVFGLWSAALLDNQMSMTLVLIVIGILYGCMAIVFRPYAGPNSVAFYTHAVFGGFSFLLGLSQLGSGSDYRPIIAVYVWLAIAMLILFLGTRLRADWMKAIASLIWLLTGIYWFVKTWEVPRLNWFGIYVPFLNGGAMVWIVLAVFGFYCASKVRYKSQDAESNVIVANVYALLSHFVVGGLLTIQIVNVFDAYDWGAGKALTLSVTWAIYALLLFVWGAYSSQRLFRWFGSIVLLIVAIKAILLDLAGEDTIYKMIVFVVLGLISFVITWINQRWRDKEPVNSNSNL